MLIENGKVHTTAATGTIQADIHVQNGKIAVIGENLEEETGELIIDVSRGQVFSGMIETHYHLGMEENAIHGEGDDVNEMSDPITPQVRAIDGCNPLDEMIINARSAGIATATAGPGSVNVIDGIFIAYKVHGVSIDEMIVQNPVTMKCVFGENPERIHQSSRIKTRINTAALLRETLAKTKECIARGEAANNDPLKMSSYGMKLEATTPVVKKELPLKCHTHRMGGILTVTHIAKKLDVNVALDHCTDGKVIKTQVKASGYPAIVGPSLAHKLKFELVNKSFTTPGVLCREGILTAITTDSPVIPQKYLSLCATLAMKDGLSEEEALKAIIINPAKVLGLEKRIGSTEEGKDENVIIYDSSLPDIQNVVRYIIINGEIAYQKA